MNPFLELELVVHPFFHNLRHSDPYKNTEMTNVSYTCILVFKFSDMFQDLHILTGIPITGDPSPESFLIS